MISGKKDVFKKLNSSRPCKGKHNDFHRMVSNFVSGLLEFTIAQN